MPSLYKFDDFVECSEADSVYCIVNSYIKPDEKSDLYNFIKVYSSETKFHLRHDRLQRGLCISKCQLKLEEKHSENYFVDTFEMDSKVRLFNFAISN